MPARIVLIVAVLAALAGGATAHAGVEATAAKACATPKYPGSGYYTSLSVTKVSCATGKAVAQAFTKCRRENGLKGRCKHKVKGYSCKEKRVSISTEFDGSVTCKLGSKVVKHTYQQNT